MDRAAVLALSRRAHATRFAPESHVGAALRSEADISGRRLAALKGRLPAHLKSLVSQELVDEWRQRLEGPAPGLQARAVKLIRRRLRRASGVNCSAHSPLTAHPQSASRRAVANGQYDEMRSELLRTEAEQQRGPAPAHLRAFYSALRTMLLECAAMLDAAAQATSIAAAYRWFAGHKPPRCARGGVGA